MPRVPFSASSLFALLACTLCVARASGAPAQEPPPTPPAHIAVVDGAATIDRDGRAAPAAANAPFVPGDHLRTTTGRVDVLFPDGTALDVDEHSAVDLQSPTLIRLTAGRVILTVWGAGDPASAVRYQIDTPAASVSTGGAGQYRVSLLEGRTQTELAVLRGAAVLDTERGSMPLHAGERAFVRTNEAPSFPLPFNSARLDAFDQWTMDQEKARTSTVSADYLPPNLQMYGGTLNRYGAWEYTAPYGYVWYPTIVSVAWHWPTHHYGRWEHAGNRLCWVPWKPGDQQRTRMPAESAVSRAAPIEAPPPAAHTVVVAHAAGASVAVPRALDVAVPRALGVAVPRALGVAVPRAPAAAIPSPVQADPRVVPSYAASPRVNPMPAPAPPPPLRPAPPAPPPPQAQPRESPQAQPREPHQRTPPVPAPTTAVPRPTGVSPPARLGEPSHSSATHGGRGR